ncbi:MAG: DnaJ domain-containing protein [Acidobacteria bacterium]|nr:DnaJ domain-containing protein [Acidobacteriota bacterium]
MAKDYYTILGVLPTATLDEIRSAYRNRVKQYHPDHFGKDSAPFLSVQEAYDILGDPENRRSYDRNLSEAGIHASTSGPSIPVEIRPRRFSVEPLRAPRRPMDLGTIYPPSSFNSCSPSFEEIFDSLWNICETPSAVKSERFRTLTMEVPLTQDQARLGGRVQVHIPAPHVMGAGIQARSRAGGAMEAEQSEMNYPFRLSIPREFGIRIRWQFR